MLTLHITQACIWGVVLNKVGLMPNLRDSIYFSTNTYTNNGYGKFLLPENWHELGPIMALSGLFTFAWTTGEVFNVVQIQRDRVSELWKTAPSRLSGTVSRHSENVENR